MTTPYGFPCGIHMARGGALQRLQPISDEPYTAPPYNSEGPTKYMTTPYDFYMEPIWQGMVPLRESIWNLYGTCLENTWKPLELHLMAP